MSEHITRERVQHVLSRHIGKDNGLSITELLACCDAEWMLKSDTETKAAERHLRKLIEQLRMEGQHICAHPSSGYFVAANADELDRTCLFLHERAMTSLKQVAAMKRVSLPDLRGQLNLPT